MMETLHLEYDGDAISTVEKDGIEYEVTVQLRRDECGENPLEDWDETGKIFSFNTRHVNFAPADRFTDDNGSLLPDTVLLSYYEHGLCKWGVARDMVGMPDWQWDCAAFAGVWVPDEGLLSYCDGLTGSERRAKLTEYARQACDLYTAYCNGDVWGYIAEVRETSDRPACSHCGASPDPIVASDSCFGFYGGDGLLDYVNEFLEDYGLCAEL